MKHTFFSWGMFHVKHTPGFIGPQCTVSAMCWVPIRLRNTQYVQPW